MHLVSTKFVPRLLTDNQKLNDFPSVKIPPNGITSDETWIYGYDVETEQQSTRWKSPASPRPKEARQVRSRVKGMLLFFPFRSSRHCALCILT
jgi:hypothetical protein